MGKSWKRFINIYIWVAFALLVIRCIIGIQSILSDIEDKAVFKCVYSVFGYCGEAIGVASLLMIAFNLWLWKWKPINTITGRTPILAKHYTGYIKSDYDHQDRDATLDIKQTFLDIQVIMKTSESTSHSIHATIEDIYNEPQLLYFYLNEPMAVIQERSAMHYGTVLLRREENNALSGNYYTSRNTRGVMKFSVDTNN